MEEYKIPLIGSDDVGKSALTIRFITDNFLDEYDPTIEDSYRKQVMIDDATVLLDILDTAGQEEFSSMRDQWMRDGKGFLLLYSIAKRSTFDDIREHRNRICKVKDEDAYPMVLVGNQCHLEDSRQVSYEEGENLAKELGIPFFEASAKEKINVEECFFEVVREIRKWQAQKSNSNRKPKKSFFSSFFSSNKKPKKVEQKQQEEAERKKKAALEVERKKKAALEVERKKNAALNAERRRKAELEAMQASLEVERKRQAALIVERRRKELAEKEQEEQAKREKEAALEAKRKKQAALEADRKRKAAFEAAIKLKEETAKEREAALEAIRKAALESKKEKEKQVKRKRLEQAEREKEAALEAERKQQDLWDEEETRRRQVSLEVREKKKNALEEANRIRQQALEDAERIKQEALKMIDEKKNNHEENDEEGADYTNKYLPMNVVMNESYRSPKYRTSQNEEISVNSNGINLQPNEEAIFDDGTEFIMVSHIGSGQQTYAYAISMNRYPKVLKLLQNDDSMKNRVVTPAEFTIQTCYPFDGENREDDYNNYLAKFGLVDNDEETLELYFEQLNSTFTSWEVKEFQGKQYSISELFDVIEESEDTTRDCIRFCYFYYLLQKMKIAHCDVAPRNVLITYDGPVLIDFGASVKFKNINLNALPYDVTPKYYLDKRVAVRPNHDVKGFYFTATKYFPNVVPYNDDVMNELDSRNRLKVEDIILSHCRQ